MNKKINELDWQPRSTGLGGEIAKITFDNGYTASCIRGGRYSYTKNGTYEIAVEYDGNLDYTTQITDDVLGYLGEEEANLALDAIKALPKKKD